MPGAWWLEAPSAGLVPPEAAGADSLPSPAWTGDLPAQASLTWSTALLAVVAGTAAPVVMAGLARRRSGGAPPSPP